MKKIALIILALALVVSGYSQQQSGVQAATTTATSSQAVSSGATSVVNGGVLSNLEYASGLVKNARPVDWLGAEVRRRETFNEDGVPYAVFLARNGCAFGTRHENQVMEAIRSLMKPGEVLKTHPSGFYYIGIETLVSPLTAGPAANPGVTNITHGASTTVVKSNVSSQVKIDLDGVTAVPDQHPNLGPIILFRRPDKSLVAGERGRPIAEALANGKPVLVIPAGMPGAGAYYTK